jgi:hypothetical protein
VNAAGITRTRDNLMTDPPAEFALLLAPPDVLVGIFMKVS